MQIELAGGASPVVTCQHCGASAPVPLATPAPAAIAAPPAATAAAALPAPAADRCPKCHAEIGSRDACPGCGLAASRMAGFASSRAALVPEAALAAWEAVLAGWDTQARHDAFIQAVAAAGVFAWAAGQYQEARRQRAGDPIATRQLERVRRTAEAAMLASAAVRRDEKAPYRSAIAILVMMVVVLVAGALYARFMRDTRPPGTGAPVVPARRGELSP